MERPSVVAALLTPLLKQNMVEIGKDPLNEGHATDVLVERFVYMLRFGCDEEDCKICRKGKKRPTIYAAKAFAQQLIMLNRKLCPRVADLYVPLINFARPASSESLIMRVRCGKVPDEEPPPVVKPKIGIMIRPQHVHKHKPKSTEKPVKEKIWDLDGHYRLRTLSTTIMKQVIDITNETKDESLLRQVLDDLADVELVATAFCLRSPDKTHKHIITDIPAVRMVLDGLPRRYMPHLFDSLNRALLDIDSVNLTLNQEIHCLHVSWLALASVKDSLEIGGRPLAITLVELGTRTPNYERRLDALAKLPTTLELLIARPIVEMIQALLVHDWHGEVVVDTFKKKCLRMLDSLHTKLCPNQQAIMPDLFQNKKIGKIAISERFQRIYAEAFAIHEDTLLDHPYLFSDSDKIALFEFWCLANMEYHHRQGWALRRMERHFSNLGGFLSVMQPPSFGITAFLGINAQRQDLLHDVTKAVAGRSISMLRRPMKVEYSGEQGVDLAGLTADLLSKTIKADIIRCLDLNLLREVNGMWFKEGADAPKEFHRLGILIGLAMYNGVKALPLDFPLMFYKKLVGEKLRVSDMQEFDPDLYKGWMQLIETSGDDLDMTYEYVYKIGEEVRTEILEYEGTEAKPVKVAGEYVEALFKAITDTLIAKSFTALQVGIETIVPRRVLRLFNSSQLRMLIAGERVIDVPETIRLLKQVTVYIGFVSYEPVITNLWKILSSLSPSQFSRFLDLVTASERIPAQFPANFKFTIFKSGSDEEMFPRGQTCMHGLGLPAYTSEAKLREKLLFALASFSAPGGDAFHLA